VGLNTDVKTNRFNIGCFAHGLERCSSKIFYVLGSPVCALSL